ncbi:MAG: hypothetical protein JXR78_15280 [Victivallales bacterium]|nr:hypothetical protein [Victivallales bacterium]
MNRGFTKVYRWEWETKAYSKSLEHVGMMQYLRYRACLSPSVIRGENLKAGEFLTNPANLSDATGISVKKVRTILADLAHDGLIVIDGSRAKKRTKISICELNTYTDTASDEGQTKGTSKGKQKEQRKANERQTKGISQGTSIKKNLRISPPYNPPPGGNSEGVQADSSVKKSKERFRAEEIELPEVLNTAEFRKVWLEWCEYRRKEKKSPLTPTSAKRQLKSFEAVGELKAVAAMVEAMTSGWTGVFPGKDSGQIPKAQARGSEYAGAF